MKDQKIYSKEDLFQIVKDHLENMGYSIKQHHWDIGFISRDPREYIQSNISLTVEVVENLKSQNR